MWFVKDFLKNVINQNENDFDDGDLHCVKIQYLYHTF